MENIACHKITVEDRCHVEPGIFIEIDAKYSEGVLNVSLPKLKESVVQSKKIIKIK